MSVQTEGAVPVSIRRAKQEDAVACGRICYEAFRQINAEHNFPPDLPDAEFAAKLLGMMFSHPKFYCVVAEVDGHPVGSNCLDERAIISGVGPITIAPSEQNRGIGRKLMEAVLERAREQRHPGVRLVQAAFHNRSLSLYARLGFDARELLSCLQGPAIRRSVDGCAVAPADNSDVEECNRLARHVHGFDRGEELSDAIRQRTAVVVRRHNRITGYATAMAFFGHAVAESNLDLQALIGAAESLGGPGILVPTRNTTLVRWCLANGLRIVYPLTLMSMGLYSEPSGVFLPSILF